MLPKDWQKRLDTAKRLADEDEKNLRAMADELELYAKDLQMGRLLRAKSMFEIATDIHQISERIISQRYVIDQLEGRVW